MSIPASGLAGNPPIALTALRAGHAVAVLLSTGRVSVRHRRSAQPPRAGTAERWAQLVLAATAVLGDPVSVG
jgi:hypothetical protein